jgi:tRNA G46 methylase TrmB
VVSERFLAEAHRVLCAGGELRVVTDHDELWEWDQRHFELVSSGASGRPVLFRVSAFEPPEWVGEGELVGTNYERKMCASGKKPHGATLTKV